MNIKPRKIQEKCAKGYFKPDIYSAIEGMTSDEMGELLKELEGTRYWVAISKYTMERIIVAQNSLNSLDPIKNGADIARAQGIISGLTDTHSMVEALKESVRKVEKKILEKNDETPMYEDDPQGNYPHN